MHQFTFAAEQKKLPAPYDPDRAAVGLERWREAAAAQTVANDKDQGIRQENKQVELADAAAGNPDVRHLLDCLFGNSPYLTECMIRDPGFSLKLLQSGPDATFQALMVELEGLGNQSPDFDTLSQALRQAKQRVALTIAIADITGTWTLRQITNGLADFAEAALGCAVNHLIAEAARRDDYPLSDPDNPALNSGFFILGMGKLGSRELNYSSDIDLIVLYDAELVTGPPPEKRQQYFVRMTRDLVRLMDERTRYGYVFRTDLRLRPDPGATPLAMSSLAAEQYYESLGQNWERAAMIKARPVAGDRAAANLFLKQLRPFIWRKNLDFAAIQDIHSIKRQINAHRGGSNIAVHGHNVKLGRGGIREIEFFAQTQQLIWGGRIADLRCLETERTLAELVKFGQIEDAAMRELTEAYRFLRRVEHRIQMINDEQTHMIPKDDAELKHLAIFLGYGDIQSFTDELLHHLHRVETHYGKLFEEQLSLGSANNITGNLVFTGTDSDPETLQTIEALGFTKPQTVDASVRAWHHGRIRATRSERARGLLTELMPALLKALSQTGAPDEAFLHFDRFLKNLPGGIQVFSMFHSNPHLLDMVANIMGGAPLLAERLSRRPVLLDNLLTADFMDPPPGAEEMGRELATTLSQANVFEDILDLSRRWANDRKFQVYIQMLLDRLDSSASAKALSDIAETAIRGLYPPTEADFRQHHGIFPGSSLAIIAMGKLGSREMTAVSDLDLIIVYSLGSDDIQSNGERPLAPSQYFARLCKRLINAISARTPEGRLYEVDMRLRPSGNAGPIATSIEAFTKYQEQNAWTWEHMALTRSRVIYGSGDLRRKIEQTSRAVLMRVRDNDELLIEVADMRARIEREHHGSTIWDTKYIRGGQVDIEFIAQYLQLRHAHDHPDILSPHTSEALRNIGNAGLVDGAMIEDLRRALGLWQPLQAMLRLSLGKPVQDDQGSAIPDVLQRRLAGIGNTDDFAALIAYMRETAACVDGHFKTLIETPAHSLRQQKQ